MKFLISGGAGFIGSNITLALVGQGHEVCVLDDLSNGSLSTLSAVKDKISFIEGSITDNGTVEEAVSGCDAVFHEAALISVDGSLKNPGRTNLVNVEGARNILEACRKKDVKRVVLASSAAIYGDEPTLVKSEDSPIEPKSPYAESKLQNEQDARKYFEEYSLETVCLRYFNVYGPGQAPDSPYSGVISKFLDVAARGEKPVIYGDGSRTRDFVFVTDVVNANLLALNSKEAAGEVFNIATGQETSLLELWDSIKEISSCTLEPEFAPERKGDIQRSVASIEKAKRILGYEPQYALKGGLEKTLNWIKESRT